MNTSIRIMLVEDNPQYREVIELALSEETNIELVAQFGAVEVALHALSDASTPIEVDLILLDIRLPGMSGVDAISQILQSTPNVKIIMLTQSDMEADVVKSIQSGAAGYLLKSSSIEEITEGIQTVAKGGNPLDASVAKYLIQALQPAKPKVQLSIQLTPRETNILELLSVGLVKKEIAEKLEISPHTVAEYVKNIYTKLDVKNAPAAVHKAFRSGLLSDD
ncbi:MULTISPECIES: response regulator transcription factor [unclassified Lentimonas]|uniref:response regulator n=1 Tax=unclassified Lentimonas TaxID=2630993 RepID=UPI0013893AD1|nr:MULTISPECIES: response regulator transcription factor [unclassified Lentimonas]